MIDVLMAFDAVAGEGEPVVVDQEREPGAVVFVLDDGRELVFDREELLACLLERDAVRRAA